MNSTFGSLGISTSGMQAAQVGLDIAGNNIANVNTEGYSRKRVNFQEGIVSETPGVTKSRAYTGVVVENIRRIRDLFLDHQIRQQNANVGYEDSVTDLTIAMNDILGEPSDSGLSAKLNQFFQSAKDLAANPELETAKTVFINSASALADSFNQIDQSVDLLKNNLDSKPTGRVVTSIKELNSLMTQLADVNKLVLSAKGRGLTANDLEDQRDLLLDKISKLYEFNIVRDGDGTFSKLTVDAHSSEAKAVANIGFLNLDSAISGITTGANTLTLSVDNGNGVATGPLTVTFESGSSIRDVVSKINRTFKAAGGKGDIASTDENGRLVLSTKLIDNSLNTDDAEVNISNTSTALAVLGLSSGAVNGSDGVKTTVLDSSGLNYIFDVNKGSNDAGPYSSTLILRDNDSIQAQAGTLDIVGGEIGGLLYMTNDAIPDMRKTLDEFAMSVKNAVNDLLSLGKTVSGNAGATLFTGTTASNLTVNSNVLSNPALLAQGKTGNVSDGEIAAQISDLFFGSGNIIGDNARSQMVLIDSPSSATSQSVIPMIPGEQITIHADGLIMDGSSSVNAGDNGFGGGSLVQIEFINAAGTVIGSTINFPTAAGAPEDRVSYSGTVPAGAAFIRFKMNGASFNDNDLTNNLGHFKLSVIQGAEDDSASNLNNRISDIVGDFGTRGSVATSKKDNANNLLMSLENRRQGTIGVSLEEEAADLIRYQNAFAANANVLKVMQEVLSTMVNLF